MEMVLECIKNILRVMTSKVKAVSNYIRLRAETPLIVLCRFPEPALSLMATTFGLASNHADSVIFPLGEFRNVVDESSWLRHDPH
jgi:hypothetical protein